MGGAVRPLEEDEPAPSFLNLPLVVSTGRDLSVMSPPESNMDQEPRVLYLEDDAVGLVHHIIEAARRAVLVAGSRDGAEVARALESREDLEVRPTSDVLAHVIADGRVIVPGPATGDPIIDLFGRWLPKLVAVAVALQPSRFITVTDRVMHDALARLRRVRVLLATEVTVRIDAESIRLPRLSSNASTSRTTRTR